MEAASGVPWIPTSGTERPIQRVPSGLPGPGGIGVRRAAHRPLGGNHHGSRSFDTILKRPTGVGWLRLPVPMTKMRDSFVAAYNYSRCELRRTTMIGPK